MKLLRSTLHPDIKSLDKKNILKRYATRAIVMSDEKILLLFTKRYNDYSLPGGGLNEGEDRITGMMRELEEETGACDISDIREFGIYEEYRPWVRDGFDVLHMISYCYSCNISEVLGETSLESYEIDNGMKPVWVSIHEAIKFNEDTIANSPKKGMSIERETFLLKLIREKIT